MNKQAWLAIGYGIFAMLFASFAELFFEGWRVLLLAQVLIAAPLLEEAVKFLGYRVLKRYTMLIALSFAVAEITVLSYNAANESPWASGVEFLTMTLLALGGSMKIAGHLTTWFLPYHYRFAAWTYPVAVLVHGLWNFYFFVLYRDETLRVPGSPILAALLLIPLFVLLKESTPRTTRDLAGKE